MPRSKQAGPVRNNNEVTYGPCQPSDFPSPANTGYPTKFKSILQANAQARIAEQDEHCRMHKGEMPKFDLEVYKIRDRYTKHVVLPGNATHSKTYDDIV